MSNINVTGQQAYFNEDAKFFKDVYIYGTLYYEFETKNVTEVFQNIEVKGNAEFLSDVYINGNLISTSSPHTGGNVNSQSLIELGYSSQSIAQTEVNTKFYNSLIYNRALNDGEILQNYNSLKTRYRI
jgi:hypothetical protein